MVTAQLVFQGHNNLRYLLTADEQGGALTIPSAGGATPDLQTDSLAGPIKQISLAGVQGIGLVAAGALTQPQARDILAADNAGVASTVGNEKIPRARVTIAPRSLNGSGWAADVDVDVDNNPEINIVSVADSVIYLDVEFIGGIGA